MDQDQPAPLWRITGQMETVEANATGGYGNGVRVSFQTRSGANGSVFVPAADYRTDRVRQLVTAAAETAEAVHTMSG